MADDPHQQKHFSTAHLLTNLRGRTISSGVITLISQGMQFSLIMVSTMVMARLLVPADFGLLAMAMTAMGFLRVFKDAGLSTATVQRDEITHAQVSNLFWINVALSGVSSVVLAACAPVIAWFYHEPRLIEITVVMSASFLLTGLGVQHLALLNRQMRFKAIAVIQIGSQVISVIVGIVMAWFNYGYWSLVWFQLSQPLAALLLTWWVSSWRPQLPQRNTGVRSMLQFGVNLTVTSFIYSIAAGTDSLLIGKYYGAGPVGLYSRAGALLRRPLDQFLTPINAVFLPVLSRIQSEPERYRRTFSQVYEAIVLGCSLFTGLFLALSVPVTLVLLGPKWRDAAAIFGAFSLSAVYIPLTHVCGWLFESQGRGKDALVTSLVSTVLGLGAIVVGLPYGAVGVAVSVSISGILIQLPLFFYMVGRSGPVSAFALWAGFLRHLPIFGAAYVATAGLQTLVPSRSSLQQLLICSSGGLVAAVIVILLYPPSRRTAFGLVKIGREFLGRRKNSAAI